MVYVGTRSEHELFFLKLFGRPRDIPAKAPDILPKSLVSLGVEGHAELPLHVKDPHPTRRYPDKKIWVWVPFSCLSMVSFPNVGPPQKRPKYHIGDRRGTTKKLCDKDFAERSGELSGAICLKPLVLLGSDR